MVNTVALEFKWSPKEMGDLFIDSMDSEGLVYWHNVVIELIDKMKPKKDKK